MNNIERTMKLVASGKTISKAIYEVYNIHKVHIPFRNDDFKVSINSLGFNTRAMNCFKREKLSTALDVVEFINKNGWNKIRSFGEGSALDTYQKLIDLAWDKLDENERAKFLIRIDEENKAKEETK